MAGLPEDLDSAIVIEQRWKNDGLQVTKPKYNVFLILMTTTLIG